MVGEHVGERGKKCSASSKHVYETILHTTNTQMKRKKKISLPIFSSSQRFKYLVSTHTQGEKYRSQQQRDTQFNDKNTAGKMIGGGIDTSKLQRLKTSFWSF